MNGNFYVCSVCQYLADPIIRRGKASWLHRCCPLLPQTRVNARMVAVTPAAASAAVSRSHSHEFCLRKVLYLCWPLEKITAVEVNSWSIGHIYRFPYINGDVQTILCGVWAFALLQTLLTSLVICFSVLNVSWVFGNKRYFLAPCYSQGKLSWVVTWINYFEPSQWCAWGIRFFSYLKVCLAWR